jgi:RNA 2',3'-cyclic 3'-phosphodiesterase
MVVGVMDRKRIFYGLEIKAPWPENLPEGRFLFEVDRHITLAFIGDIDFHSAETILKGTPLPSRKVGFGGFFDECLFLPPIHPRCVSWHVDWFSGKEDILTYQHELTSYLVHHKLLSENDLKRGFLPHVTICRKPFHMNSWKNNFHQLPFITTNIHLYESVGKSHYSPIWSFPLLPPFEEIDHTADIAFTIRGDTVHEVYLHACLALAFEHPPILRFMDGNYPISTVDDIVIALNELITKSDSEEGCPLKAVSFHSPIESTPNHTLTWEMIVDVYRS